MPRSVLQGKGRRKRARPDASWATLRHLKLISANAQEFLMASARRCPNNPLIAILREE